jgi:hypothetical protein
MFEFTWQYFSNLPEIKRLPLHEQKKLFLIEAKNWRDYQNYNMMMANGGPQSNGSTSGIGADGPLNGATVTARGTSVTTNALGEFTFPFELGANEEVTITGGTDSITGIAFEGELKGYITPTIKVVSPLTTIAYYDEDAATFDQAIDNVISAAETAGFTGIDKTILTEDYVKKSIVENDDRAVALQAFTTYVDSMAEAVAPSLVGLATSRLGTPSNVKQAKINLYKYFGSTRTFSAKSFIKAERFELDETKTTILNSATTAVESVLKEELLSVVKDSLADSNYRTTRIQTINRAIKQDIKAQIVKAENDRDATVVKTDSADVLKVVNDAVSSLARLETTKENINERTTDDTKTTKLTDVTSLFASGDKTGLYFILSNKSTVGPYQPQNIYALTTDLQVGTKLFVKDVEAGTFCTMDETVNITIKDVVVKTVGWVLANQANTYSDDAKYVGLTSSDGNTAYTVGLDGTIKEKKIFEKPVDPPTPPTGIIR